MPDDFSVPKITATPKEGLQPNPKARLKQQFHEVCRFRHVSLRTEEAYWAWVVRLVRHFHSQIHPKDLSGDQLAEFLTHLATVGQVAASTQNQALNALSFLYTQVLRIDLGDLGEFLAASRRRRVPVVLSKAEVQRLLSALDGTYRLMGQVLYGSGWRLLELLRLRVQDLDFARNQIVVRGGKGDKDWVGPGGHPAIFSPAPVVSVPQFYRYCPSCASF
jgi:site-specific recombinase XerD